MQIIERADWPAPLWSASKLEESRQTTARGSGDGFAATLARARLLSEAGDLDGAKRELDIFAQAREGRTLGSGELRQIIPVALLVQNERLATQFLDLVYPTTTVVTFGVTNSPTHGVVHMRVERRDATFLLSEAVFRHDHGEILLQRLVDTYPILACFLDSPSRTDGTVAINLGDAGDTPGLTFCGNRSGFFLIPDSIFMDSRGYQSMRRYYQDNFQPWEKRLPIAFWRGATTGRPADSKKGWRSLPRIRLCEVGADHLDLIDAGLTKIGQIDDPTAEVWLHEAGLMRPHVPPSSFQQYKYQIDIDGNTTSWPGLFIKLLTGSVVLKVPPRDGFEQWFYDRLQPWVNFIPLAADMSDLVDKVRWLKENDAAAKAIGESGYRLAEDLTYEREIRRAVPTVAAAMKDASAEPIVDLDFSVGGDGASHLREGWMPPDLRGVDTAGFQSRVDLLRPHGIGGFIVRLDVSPASRVNQHLSIAVNGQPAVRQCMIARSTIYVPLSRATLADNALVALTLLHPDAVAAASAASPGDPRRLGIRLHRIAVLGPGATAADPSPELAQASAALRGMDQADHARDLATAAPQAAPRGPLFPLYTYHGTLAYADAKTGCLRHGPADAVPHNLLMMEIEGDVTLFELTSVTQHWIVRLRPEGPLAAQADPAGLDTSGHAEQFTAIRRDNAEFAIGAAGLVLCAEPTGELKLARNTVGIWERFRTSPDDG